MFYLYIKTHNITGLKYLGKTKRDPFKYKGSGKYWRNHIKHHGYNVTTEILGIFDNLEDFTVAALSLSKQLDIVNSPAWANLMPESGDGSFGRPMTEDHKQRISNSLKGKKRSEQHNKNFANSIRGTKWSEEQKLQHSIMMTGKKRKPYKKQSAETRLNHSKARLGKKRGPYKKSAS